jgi:enoyl-CoA hydratase/carnithine racemase
MTAAAADAASLLVDTHGSVRVLTLNRPDRRNSFTTELYLALTEALRVADGDRDVAAVILTGAGTAFCAGTDLEELSAIAAGHGPEQAGSAFPGLLQALIEIEVPLIAAVNGAGVGLGFTILSFCDLVVMVAGARLKAPFAQMGVPPEAASSLLLPLRMGWQRAASVLLTADWLTAQDAVNAGIATEVCPADALMERAMSWADRIAAGSPGAARTIKGLMQAAQRDAVLAARRREDAAFAQLFGRSG